MNKETAIKKGEKALASLEEAQRILSSASRWGILDIFGGGSIVSFIKHTRIDRARAVLSRCSSELSDFSCELSYIPDYNINIGTFLTLLDVFSDSIIADVLVQSKIDEAKAKVGSAIRAVESALERLRSFS